MYIPKPFNNFTPYPFHHLTLHLISPLFYFSPIPKIELVSPLPCPLTYLAPWLLFEYSCPLGYSATRLLDFLLQHPIYLRDLFTPPSSFPVFHIHDLFLTPVKMISDESYLLVEAVEGVALYSPMPISTSNSCSHFGHFTFIVASPFISR